MPISWEQSLFLAWLKALAIQDTADPQRGACHGPADFETL
jgi:hypothetical protein